MMDRTSHIIRALWIIQMMVMFPMLQAAAYTLSTPEITINENRVEVSWRTTTETNASIQYWRYGDRQNTLTVSDSEYSREHSLLLDYLDFGRRYEFRISTFSSGNNPLPRNMVGTFIVPNEFPPPTPSGLEVVNVTEHTATLEWNRFSTEDVPQLREYIIYRDGDEITRTTQGRYIDRNLDALSAYMYQIAAIDGTGSISGLSEPAIATTLPPDLDPPEISDIRLVGISNTSITMFWKTDEPARSRVYYGINEPTQVRTVPGLNMQHTVGISNLQQGSVYTYFVQSCDEAGNCANSTRQTFTAGHDLIPPTLEMELPEVHNTNSLEVNGTTKPLARVYFYINEPYDRHKPANRVAQADINGFFRTTIPLNPRIDINVINARAEDLVGNYREEQYEIYVDTEAPIVELSEIPLLTDQRLFPFIGNISEDVTLEVFVEHEPPRPQNPPIVTGIRESSTSSSQVDLRWDTLSSQQASFYRVYRDGFVRGVTSSASSASFSDCVTESSQYVYRVAAVNEDCREGPRSDTLTVRTPEGISCADEEEGILPVIEDPCDSSIPVRTADVAQGEFRQSVELREGRNNVRLVFTDRAGNSVSIEKSIIYDEKPPTILWHNLRDLSPAYSQDVTVVGQVDEPATVTITVNEEYSYVGRTDDDGYFEIDIELEKLDFSAILDNRRATRTGTPTGRVISNTNLVPITGRTIAEDDEIWDTIDTRNFFGYQEGLELPETTRLLLEVDDGVYDNYINITAVDLVGRVGRSEFDFVRYEMCSLGAWWNIRFSDPQPALLLPRHMLTGIAQIHMNYELTWQGGRAGLEDDEVPQVRTQVAYRSIARADQWKWDNQWFRLSSRPGSDPTQGVIIFQSNALNRLFDNSALYRRELSSSVRERDTGNFTTYFDMEQNISNHRINNPILDGGCITPMFGCVRLPLVMTLSFTDPAYDSRSYDPIIEQGATRQTGRMIQRQCVDVEVGIDRRMDPAVIPESFLRNSINFLNRSISFIDTVLEPVQQIYEYTMYACLGSWVALYVMALNKGWTCEFSGRIRQFFGGGFKPEIAEAGLCEYVYGKEETDGTPNPAYTACDACTQAVKRYNRLEEIMMNICDRLACPSAPSFMEYVRQANLDSGRQVTVNRVAEGSEDQTRDRATLTLHQRSDCHGVDLSMEGILYQYKIWEQYKKNRDAIEFPNPFVNYGQTGEANNLIYGTTSGFTKPEVSCFDPHDWNPNCCVVEYMRKYDSACGLSGAFVDGMSGMFFDEMVESVCVAGAYAQVPQNLSTDDTQERLFGTSDSDDSSHIPSFFADNHERWSNLNQDLHNLCNSPLRRTFNAMAAVCERSPGMAPQIINTNLYYRTDVTEPEGERRAIINRQGALGQEQTGSFGQGRMAERNITYGEIPAAGSGSTDTTMQQQGQCPPMNMHPYDDMRVYYVIQPREARGGTHQSDIEFDVYRGMVTRYTTLANIQGVTTPRGMGSIPVGQSQVFTPLSNPIPGEFFKITPDQSQSRVHQFSDINQEGLEALKEVGRCLPDNQLTDTQAAAIYREIKSKAGIGEKEIIVDPTSSFLRSVQCLCLPGIVSFLKLWRAILTAVKACLETILLTGDGSPGICREVLSVYICDLIFDAVSCFTNRYGVGFQRSDSITFPGNVIGTFTSAGREVQQSIAGRYGNTNFFQAMFGERQLVHALCLWAFTGTFDFDFRALSQGEFGTIPVKSQALLHPCHRRFISYDERDGRTTWTYLVGVGLVAGADLNYRLQLICSDDFSCGEFGSGAGQCDCVDVTTPVRPYNFPIPGARTSLRQFDVLEESVERVVTTSYRYDKAILTYTYINKDNERVEEQEMCSFRDVGGQPPGFCAVHPTTGEYRCSVDFGMENTLVLRAVRPDKEIYEVGGMAKIEVDWSQIMPEDHRCTSAQTCPFVRFAQLDLTYKGRPIIDREQHYYPMVGQGQMSMLIPPRGIYLTEEILLGTSSSIQNLLCMAEPGSEGFIQSCSGNLPRESLQMTITAVEEGDDLRFRVNGVECEGNGEGNFLRTSTEEICRIPENTQGTCHCRSGESTLRFNINTQPGLVGISGGTQVTVRPRIAWIRSGALAEGGRSPLCDGNPRAYIEGTVRIFESQEAGASTYMPSSSVYRRDGREEMQNFQIVINCQQAMQATTEQGQTLTFENFVSNRFTQGSVTQGTPVEIFIDTRRDIAGVRAEIFRKSQEGQEFGRESIELRRVEGSDKWNASWTPQYAGNFEVMYRIQLPGTPINHLSSDRTSFTVAPRSTS